MQNATAKDLPGDRPCMGNAPPSLPQEHERQGEAKTAETDHNRVEPHQDEAGMDPGLWGTLPEEIVDRILAFLPILSFFRLQVVCKRWNSLRFSHGFLEIYSEVVSGGPWLLVFAKGKDRPDVPHIPNLQKLGLAYNFMLKRVSFVYSPKSRKWYNLALPCLPPQASVLAASGGLLCCEGGAGYFLVCNPVTNTWRPLPPSLLDRNTMHLEMVADCPTRSYKVIAVGGSFLYPPGEMPSDGTTLGTNISDYRVRLVLNRLRSSSVGGNYAGFSNCDFQPRNSYPGFPTPHAHPNLDPFDSSDLLSHRRSANLGSPSASAGSSTSEFHAGFGLNQLRVLRVSRGPCRSWEGSLRETAHPGCRTEANHTSQEGASQLRCTSPATGEGSIDNVNVQVTPSIPTLVVRDGLAVQSSGRMSASVSSTSEESSDISNNDIIAALDRLHISTPRSPELGAGSSTSDGFPISPSGKLVQEVLEGNSSLPVSLRVGKANLQVVDAGAQVPDHISVSAISSESEDVERVGNSDDRLRGCTSEQSFTGSAATNSSLLLPPHSARLLSSCNDDVGLTPPSGSEALWRVGAVDDAVGLASLLEQTNLRLSRDSGYHFGHAFTRVRNNLLRSAEAAEARPTDYRVGVMLNRIRSNAIAASNAISNNSDYYGFTVEVYDSKVGRWERAGLLPREVDSISKTCYCNGYLYCLAFNLFRIFRFSIVEGSWTSIDIPAFFFFIVPDLVELYGRLFLVGGVKGTPLANAIVIWELEQSRREWTEVLRMPDDLCKEFHRGEHFGVFRCVGNGALLFFMGENFPRILVCNLNMKSWQWSPLCHGIENRYQRGFKGFCFEPRLDALV